MDNKNYDGIRWKQRGGYWISDKYGYQHRYIYEKHLGFMIPKGFIVHHIDEDKSNNMIENLKLMTKEEHSSLHSAGENNRMFGRKHTEEAKRKNSEAHKGKTSPMKDKHHSEEAKRKNSQAHKGKTSPMKDKHHSEEVKKRISKLNKGKENPMLGKHYKLKICPYCKKEGGINIMHRWHFDNCKNKGA